MQEGYALHTRTIAVSRRPGPAAFMTVGFMARSLRPTVRSGIAAAWPTPVARTV